MPTTLAKTLDRYSPEPNSGCWVWLGSMRGGYGAIRRRRAEGYVGAHRFFYEHHRGQIPDGMLVCHRCDNKLCVNPDHLFVGSYSDNAMDAVDKGTWPRSGEPSPNRRLSPEDVAAIRGGDEKQRILAQRYGIAQSHVSRIKNRKQW